jgi:hypothetical protein
LVTSRKDAEPSRPRRPPATTLEGREAQMISLAVDLTERQLREGTASSQVITHYLKLGTTREKLEQEKLARENILLAAKAEGIASGQRVEDLYEKAIKAMRSYQGQEVPEDYED